MTATTDAATEYADMSGTPILPSEFFPQANGRLVEVSGTLNGGSIDAGQVEFED